MRLPVALLLVLSSSLSGRIFYGCVEKPAELHPQRDPDLLSQATDQFWQAVAVNAATQAHAEWEKLRDQLEEERRHLPGATPPRLPRASEIARSGSYGQTPEVMVDTGTGAIFPVEPQAPTRFSWYQTARDASTLAYNIQAVLSRMEQPERGSGAAAQLLAYENASGLFETLSTQMTRLAQEVRNLETWGPQLQSQWAREKAANRTPKAYLLAHLSELQENAHLTPAQQDQIVRDLREVFRPHRTIHREFLPDRLPASLPLLLPIMTDVEDQRFLREVEGALDTYWTQSSWAKNLGLSFKIQWFPFPKNTAFAEGKQTLAQHLDHFPPKTLAMTTGGLSTYVKGRALVLGPDRINPRTLAHELGHLLGFEDCYFRTLSEQGIFGTAILEWTNPLYPDDLMCDNSVGVARAEAW